MKIKNILYLLLITTILFGCSSNVEEENIQNNSLEKNNTNEKEENNQTIIVAFGDSLTQGLGVDRDEAYPAQLQEKLDEKNYNTKVYNSGLSGETTTGALERINWVLQLNPDIVILTTGANDAFRGIDIEIIKNNLDSIVKTLVENNIIVIVGGMEIVENLGEQYTTEFENMYPEISQKYDTYLIESFLGEVGGNSQYNQEDEIHPTKEGYSIIVENNIMPVLETVLKEKYQ